MNRADFLQSRFAGLEDRLQKVPLAKLPTPVRESSLECGDERVRIWIKQDNLTGEDYGGNKVRKLEYLFGRLLRRGRKHVATFGTIGSNHALATALYARKLNVEPICFLSHQTRTELTARTLNMHLANNSEIVPYGGIYAERLRTLRTHLWNRDAAVIPMGGSSWLGSASLVNAGLELAAQVSAGQLPEPDRIYVATGTMGTAAGLSLGLALAGLASEVHAVRVSHTSIANDMVLQRLMRKTAYMLNRLAPTFPADLAARTNISLRDGYFAPGYAHSNEKTDAALETARAELGLGLEPTYTGKAMAALIDDLPACAARGDNLLFWNTYHSAPLPAGTAKPSDTSGLPREFLRYFC